MSTSVPSGAMGVASEENKSSRASCANRRRFWQHGRSMLKVALHWVVSRHQLAMGKDLGSPMIPDRK